MTDAELSNKLMALHLALKQDHKPALAEIALLGAHRIRELARECGNDPVR